MCTASSGESLTSHTVSEARRQTKRAPRPTRAKGAHAHSRSHLVSPAPLPIPESGFCRFGRRPRRVPTHPDSITGAPGGDYSMHDLVIFHRHGSRGSFGAPQRRLAPSAGSLDLRRDLLSSLKALGIGLLTSGYHRGSLVRKRNEVRETRRTRRKRRQAEEKCLPTGCRLSDDNGDASSRSVLRYHTVAAAQEGTLDKLVGHVGDGDSDEHADGERDNTLHE